MADHNNPQSRTEEILIATIDGTEYDKLPQSRLEELLLELKEVIEEGGGGGEGGLIQKIFLNGVEQQITNKAVYLTVITNTVNDLVNYYLKTDTYSKLEVNNLIAAIQTVHLQKVETLPTEDISQTTIYLVPKSTLLTNNVYDEYINTDGTSAGWELIGDTQIDLSDYVTFTDLEALLDDYVLATDLTTTLADYALAADVTAALSNKVDKVAGKGLSTNDFTDEYKAAIGSNTTAITAIKDGQSIDSFADVETALDEKVDAVSGKGLSTNDYTNADKAIVDGVTTALAGKVDTSSVGSASGVAELDSNGKVPSSQLPSYVDDVLEYASQSAFPAEGETGKIYIAKDNNKTYRWSGTAYVEISESLALGETSSTAYAGNKGKANADAISAIKDGTSIDSFADVETALAGKVDKVTGKGLSTNDFTDTYKDKVDNNAGAIEAIVNEYGSKNLLLNRATSQTINGVTFTVNADGTVTANGTATANAGFQTGIYLTLNGTYKLNSKDLGGSADTYSIAILLHNGGSVRSYGDDAEFNANENGGQSSLYIDVKSGVTVSNLVFRPMIRDARIADPTYVPYAMTNRELTGAVMSNTINEPTAGEKVTIVDGGYTIIGKLVVVNVRINVESNIAAGSVIMTGFPISKNNNGLNIVPFMVSNNANFVNAFLYAQSNGAVQTNTELTAGIKYVHSVYVTS